MAVTVSGIDWGDLGRFICPPILDGNGNIYLCAVSSTDASKLKMMKSSNGGTSFAEVDSGGAPDCGNNIDAVTCIKDGTTIHIAFTYNNTMYLRYSTFTMSDNGGTPDEWVVDNEAVYNGYVMDNAQHVDIAVRSDGDVIIVHASAAEDGEARLDYSRREGGSWTTVSLDDGNAAYDWAGATICMGENDLAYIFLAKASSTAYYYYKTLNSSNTLSSATIVDGSLALEPWVTGVGVRPVYYDDGGVERITYGFASITNYGATGVIDDGGTPGSIANVSHTTVQLTGSAWAQLFCFSLAVDVDTKTVYLVYSDSTDNDLYYVSCEDDGVWSSETEIEDGVSVTLNGGVNATVYTRDLIVYLAYTFNDSGTIKFAEELLYTIPLDADVSDSVAVTENSPVAVQPVVDRDIDVSDSIAVTESVGVAVSAPQISKTDSVTVAESTDMFIPLGVTVMDYNYRRRRIS